MHCPNCEGSRFLYVRTYTGWDSYEVLGIKDDIIDIDGTKSDVEIGEVLSVTVECRDCNHVIVDSKDIEFYGENWL